MKSLVVLPAVLVLAWASAGAEMPPPEPEHLIYSILRNGSPIGQDTLDIDNDGHVTSVNRSTNIEVSILFMNAYTYRYTGNETWKNDQLTAFTSRTDDNGTMHNVSLRSSGDPLQLDADGHHATVAKTIGLDDFWKPQLLSKTTVLDTSDGHQMTFAAQDLGMQTVTYRGSSRPAHHFKLTGDINRDLWFDGNMPVRFQMTAKDGSVIVSQLQ